MKTACRRSGVEKAEITGVNIYGLTLMMWLTAVLAPITTRAVHSELMAEYLRSDFTVADERRQERTKFDPQKREAEMVAQRQAVHQAMSQPPVNFPLYAMALAEKHTAMGTGNRIPISGVTIPLGIADISIPENVAWDWAFRLFNAIVFGSITAVVCVYCWSKYRRLTAILAQTNIRWKLRRDGNTEAPVPPRPRALHWVKVKKKKKHSDFLSK